MAAAPEPSQVNVIRGADFMGLLASNAGAALRAAEQPGRNHRAAPRQVRLPGLSHSSAAEPARFLLEADVRPDRRRGARERHAPLRPVAALANY